MKAIGLVDGSFSITENLMDKKKDKLFKKYSAFLNKHVFDKIVITDISTLMNFADVFVFAKQVRIIASNDFKNYLEFNLNRPVTEDEKEITNEEVTDIVTKQGISVYRNMLSERYDNSLVASIESILVVDFKFSLDEELYEQAVIVNAPALIASMALEKKLDSIVLMQVPGPVPARMQMPGDNPPKANPLLELYKFYAPRITGVYIDKRRELTFVQKSKEMIEFIEHMDLLEKNKRLVEQEPSKLKIMSDHIQEVMNNGSLSIFKNPTNIVKTASSDISDAEIIIDDTKVTGKILASKHLPGADMGYVENNENIDDNPIVTGKILASAVLSAKHSPENNKVEKSFSTVNE